VGGRPTSAACSSRKSIASATPRSQAKKVAPPSKAPPSAAAARSAARAERQAVTLAAGTSARGKGAKAALPGAARAGIKKDAPGRVEAKMRSKNRQSVGSCLERMVLQDNDEPPVDDESTADREGVLAAPEAEVEGKMAEEGEDLMAYLMPIVDEESAEEASEDAEDAAEIFQGAVDNANDDAAMEGVPVRGQDSKAGQNDAQTRAADPIETGDGPLGEAAEAAVAAVTPPVRKVLASSDIFTPDSSSKASPAPGWVVCPLRGGEQGGERRKGVHAPGLSLFYGLSVFYFMGFRYFFIMGYRSRSLTPHLAEIHSRPKP